MPAEIIPASNAPAALARPAESTARLSKRDAERILGAWRSGKSKHTLDSYQTDLAFFAKSLGVGTDEVVENFLSMDGQNAILATLKFREQMQADGLAPTTINRRVAAVRSLAGLGKMLGFIEWTLPVKSLRVIPYRDTRGPGREAVKQLLEWLSAEAALPASPAGGGSAGSGSISADRRRRRLIRDKAIVRLMFDLALRRGEVVGLNLSDLRLATSPPSVEVLGKGEHEKLKLTLPAPTVQSLRDWLAVRGGESNDERDRDLKPDNTTAPLFTNFDPARKGHRLTGRSVHRIVGAWGAAALGFVVKPHGFRHSAITAALDDTGGDVRRVQKFSRHEKLETLLYYDDALKDFAGEIADLVSKSVD